MKKLMIIAKQQSYLNIITKQLEVIFGNQCKLSSGTLQEVTKEMLVNQDVIVLSKETFMGIIRPFIPSGCPVLIVQREVNILGTKQIFNLPKGQRILVISDMEENAKETAQSLKEIYFEHEYIFYRPEEPLPKEIDWIVTPGEQELVPRGFRNVIDIGPRGVSFEFVLEIAQFLNIIYDQKTLMNRFLKSHLLLSQTDHTNVLQMKEKRVYENYQLKPIEAREVALLTEDSFKDSIYKIEEHGFLEESIAVLEVYSEAKKKLESIGRSKVKEKLAEKKFYLSEQQLRLRLEVMQDIGLVIARQGRGGTKISGKGEVFLKRCQESKVE